jgi:hypothetical protein
LGPIWHAEQDPIMHPCIGFPFPVMKWSREAKVEARHARREAARAREESPEMNRMPGGGDVMGGGDSLAAARERCAAS